jgi:hypothetical protein
MPYFLDGNNLIGIARGVSRPSEEDRGALVAEVADRLRQTHARALLFFDGPGEKRTSLGNLSVRECGAGGADEAILREIGRSPAPQEIIVVTADRELARRARDSRARALSPGDFWSRFGVSKGPPRRESGGTVDVEEWMRYFADEENRER